MASVVPALPLLAQSLQADYATVQFVVSAYLLGLGLFQPVQGLLSDRFGRRPVLLAGYGVFLVASLAASFATDIAMVIAARFLQAMGVSVATVVTRAIVRDSFEPGPAATALSFITAVMGGSALMGFPTLSTAVPLVRSGKIRALGVTGPKGNPALPGVPAIADTLAGFEVVSWFGILAPAKFPADMARRIDQEIQKALADSSFRDKVQSDGTEIIGMGSADFPAYLRQDLQKWRRVVEISGAKVD
jgi:MFS family permease